MKPSARVEMMPIGQCAASELQDGKLSSQPPPGPCEPQYYSKSNWIPTILIFHRPLEMASLAILVKGDGAL